MANCTYTVPDMDASGDNYYGQFICDQTYISYFWKTYGMEGNKEYWDDGFGWEDPCNVRMPLGRMFNACYLLTYSAEDWGNDRYDTNILQWARRYVRENIEDVRSKCGDGSAAATAFWGWFTDDRVEIYLPFFYNSPVVERAATLLHESRHLGGKEHNAKFPPGSVFGEGEDGADSDWEYSGAWMYDTLYLWWFYAQGARTTSAQRQRARQVGNVQMDNAFAKHPGRSI